MTQPEYTIRMAEFHDAEAIFRLIKGYASRLIPRSLSDIVGNIDRFLVCEMRKKVCGVVSWQILPEIGAPRNPSVEIKSLAVRRDVHKLGIGRALVEAAIRRIEPLHPVQIIALTFTPEFFRKLGFREIRKEKLIHKIYMGCVNCSKYNSPYTCPEVAMGITLRRTEG